jgi:hypothetical protein
MSYKKGFPDPSNRQAEAKRNKRKRNEPRTLSAIKQRSEELSIYYLRFGSSVQSSLAADSSVQSSSTADLVRRFNRRRWQIRFVGPIVVGGRFGSSVWIVGSIVVVGKIRSSVQSSSAEELLSWRSSD